MRDLQIIGDGAVEADLGRDRLGEAGEATRHQNGAAAARLHRADQRPRARHQRDPLGQALFDDGLIQPFEQRDPRVERGGEIEFAAHRAFGHLGDLLLDPGIVGQFVDALDGDHGRIHVGDQQPLPTVRRRLHDDVGRVEPPLQRLTRRQRIAGEVEVRRDTRIDPARRRDGAARRRQFRLRGRQIGIGQWALGCYQRGDEHGELL